jgi:hypothetical protein
LRFLRSASLAALLAMPCTANETAQAWTDTPAHREQARAQLQALNAELLSHPSATLTLERWCSAHHMASPALVVAIRVRGAHKPLPAELRKTLQILAGEPVKYRRVQLSCGDHVLSEADNWYLPDHLTATMNRQLDTTDTSFGRIVMPLHFRRKTLDANLLWSPLPAGREMRPNVPGSGHDPLSMPHQLLRHRAVLYGADNRPFSALIETYTDQVLAFPLPKNH